jgi:predicted O-linked N-acetylglucosamine transferase (SPINDLY family)
VGWLARWIYEHHDRSQFQIFTYFVATPPIADPLQQWYYDRSDGTYFPSAKGSGEEIFRMAERVYQDKIDILIDLDSLTLDGSCELMSLRAAPIQATWLGWDASSVPTIDYFLADPYVLPDDAQDYYQETIWRLPQTYIAVAGFEAGVPSLRRDRLDIPHDAVVFYSAQKGYKRHPDTVRRQMRIIQAVPDSYFLVKGLSDQSGIRDSFTEIAAQEGVAADRLRFLPPTVSEEVHRADMAIADVILDTYPYNGATTTLEALWMGIPIVTQVGQQFFARYSYTMLKNAGIATGIATTADEYVAWGIRYGTDAALRREVSWQLKQSRQTAPLWQPERFTRHLESAYREMWQRYLGSSSG